MPPLDPTPAPTVMAAPPENFQRLPGRVSIFHLRFRGTAQLYLGNFCLVQVEVFNLRESYRKFAYKDIQSIEICRTSRGLSYNIVFCVFAAFFLAIAAATGATEARWTMAAFIGICALLLLVNVFRGATCRFVVQTAVGKQRLPSLVRLKPAHRALTMIAERVAAAQGELEQAAAARQMDDFLVHRSVQQYPRAAVVNAAVPSPQEPAALY